MDGHYCIASAGSFVIIGNPADGLSLLQRIRGIVCQSIMSIMPIKTNTAPKTSADRLKIEFPLFTRR